MDEDELQRRERELALREKELELREREMRLKQSEAATERSAADAFSRDCATDRQHARDPDSAGELLLRPQHRMAADADMSAPNREAENTRLFSFRGRVRRKHFIVVIIGSLVAGWLFGVVGGMALALEPDGQPGVFSSLLILAGFAALTWVQLAALLKRCTDVGISRWWTLLVLVPLAGLGLVLYLMFANSTEDQ